MIANHWFDGKQSSLIEGMQALMEPAQESHFTNMKHHMFASFAAGHGRIENHFCHVVEIPKDHPQREKWRDLKTLAIIISARTIKGKESWESRLLVSSHPVRAKYKRMNCALNPNYLLKVFAVPMKIGA
ncbi:hypothetical protein Pan54_03400 [Rubinisphaera italica]|uniref:Uncharacterized protein n=2 Tax=Rubinisphaera italica TaxID=2527969 RepID=A0A5C5XCJ6_9PLAN|nr:hypothetical protein Pan54_03400 [Rubinisphaera italica]